MSAIVVGLVLLSLGVQEEVDAARFGQLLSGLHEGIRDVTFAYEGGVRGGGGAGAAGVDLAKSTQDYQGRYRYRSDGAEFLDLYSRGTNPDQRQEHELLQNLGGRSSLTAVPDLKQVGSRSPPSKSKSARVIRPSALNRPGSPDRILYLWYFDSLTDPTSVRYKFQGWEEIDGRRCLRVELDAQAGARPEQTGRFRFGIDLTRGGHLLKVEFLEGNEIVARSDHIRLEQFTAVGGEAVWLPLSGEFGSCQWESVREKKVVCYQDPVLVESYRIIAGSVVVNQGLKDDDLTIQSNAKRYPEFRGFKADAKNAARPLRTDPAGVQKRLDDSLADADTKAARLEASAPERDYWNLSQLVAVGLPGIGVVLLALAGTWKLRSIAR